MRRQFPERQTGWLQDVLAGLADSTAQRLRNAGTLHKLGEGTRLERVSDAAVRVESGMARLAVRSDERRLTVGLFGPGDTILAPLFHGWKEDLYMIEALEESELLVVPQAAVLEAAAKDPELGRRVMQQLSWGTWHLMQTVEMLAFYNLPQRVARVLLNLAAMFGVRNERGRLHVGLRFTQEELAELIGARRETLSTILQEFRDEEILDIRYARIDIKDLDALQRIAGSGPLPYLNPRPGVTQK